MLSDTAPLSLVSAPFPTYILLIMSIFEQGRMQVRIAQKVRKASRLSWKRLSREGNAKTCIEGPLLSCSRPACSRSERFSQGQARKSTVPKRAGDRCENFGRQSVTAVTVVAAEKTVVLTLVVVMSVISVMVDVLVEVTTLVSVDVVPGSV